MRFENLLRIILTATLIWAVLGCSTTQVRYEITPPSTEQGRACVVQCAAIRETCMGNESRNALQKKQMCEKTNDIQYSACVSKATNSDQEKECRKKRSSCYVYEETARCKHEYDTCFVNCGGTIKEIREEKK